MAILVLFCLMVVGLVSAKMHTSYYDGNIATLHEHPNGDRIVTSEWISNVPYWPQYPYRNIQTMDGNWFFGYSNDFNINTTIKPSEMIGLTPNITYVPSAFDVKLPGVEGPRGTAFYRANVTIEKGSDIMVYISACAFYCQLYFDGIYIGDHKAGGYQAFYYVIKSDNTDNTNHEIFIVSNNEYNFYSAPVYTGGDFYHYGGLNRNVLVHTLPTPNEYDNYINQVFVNGYNIDKGTINVNVTFGNKFSNDKLVNFKLHFDGDKSNSYYMNGTISSTSQWIQLSNIAVPNYKLWSIDSPNLHTMELEWVNSSNDQIDTIEVRFGIREVGIDPDTYRITLNKEIIKLKGWDRHTMYPDTGNALTLSQIEQDMTILKQAGANYVRGAHYPQDQRWLDLCDENGIIMWSETLGPGVSTSDLKNPYFMKYQIQQVNEMLDSAYNNPSILWWGFYNEGPSNDKNAIPGYNASATAIRARDNTRYITWANNHHMSDVIQSTPIADIASFNDYPAWYNNYGDINYCYTIWAEYANDVITKWKKPFLISETGAGGVYEYNNSTNVKWSQLYQSQVIYADIYEALNNSQISGITVWQFSDIKANQGATSSCGQCDYYTDETLCAYIDVSCSRPGGENHKGSIDFWRRYKQGYTTAQDLFINFKPN